MQITHATATVLLRQLKTKYLTKSCAIGTADLRVEFVCNLASCSYNTLAPKTAKLFLGCCQAITKLSSNCGQDVVKLLSSCRHAVAKLSSSCRQAVVKLSSSCRQIQKYKKYKKYKNTRQFVGKKRKLYARRN